MSEKKVTVTVASGRITVDPSSVEVHQAHDHVRWVCDTSEFTIEMPGFTIDHRRENGKHHGVSGTFPAVGKIKYNVHAPGAEMLDPDVDVIPVG
jgi:hypothetical protein